ncbi:MAG: signal peptide peptidase SppA [Gammaproteobacteria bacterium]|nr:signal peptide peptidase SppA [Gammaproteobacteria bacterium]
MRRILLFCLTVWLGGVFSVLAGCITINLPPPPGPLEEEVLSGTASSKVLLVDVSGLISSKEVRGIYPQPGLVASVKEVLTVAAEDSDVKALVVRVNSPGGTVTASDVLYHEIRAFKEKRKIPVVASIMGLGTSGGYYVASAADKIVAHSSSVTGSIGVIMLTVDASGLLEKIGVEANTVASGPKKGMGSPLRPMTSEEREVFQSVIDSFHDRFLDVVQQGRPQLSAKQIRTLADGRIYSGTQAKELGLVDDVGYLEDAIELAKNAAGLEEAKVVTYHRPGEYRHNIYSSFLGAGTALAHLSNLDAMALLHSGTPQFMYLWMP